MEELHKIVKKKYKEFDITPQHLGKECECYLDKIIIKHI